MWELVSGVMLMLVLFAILMGGMIIVTRGDDADLDPGDVMPRVTREVLRVATVVGKGAPLDRAVTMEPLAGVGVPAHAVAPGARVGAQREPALGPVVRRRGTRPQPRSR